MQLGFLQTQNHAQTKAVTSQSRKTMDVITWSVESASMSSAGCALGNGVSMVLDLEDSISVFDMRT